MAIITSFLGIIGCFQKTGKCRTLSVEVKKMDYEKIIKQNKCLITVAMGFIALAVFAGVTLVYARNANVTGDEIVTTTESEDYMLGHFVLGGITAPTSTVLVDRNDTANFPHFRSTGDIRVSKIEVGWDTRENAATTTVKIGVIASTTPTGDLQDILYFDEVTFTTGTAADRRHQKHVFDYSPAALRISSHSGTATSSFLRTSDRDLLVPYFATTTEITSPTGRFSTFPEVGDLVLRVSQIDGTATVTVTELYDVK